MHIHTQFVGEVIQPRSLLEGPLVCGEGALRMGPSMKEHQKGTSIGFGDDILGIHK
jgi:hypothetical protein